LVKEKKFDEAHKKAKCSAWNDLISKDEKRYLKRRAEAGEIPYENWMDNIYP
jgi:hypothetical protein